MATTPSFLHPHTHVFDFPISQVRRGNPDDVMKELERVSREGVIEKVAEIDSFHGPVKASQTEAPLWEGHETICEECWTVWPCATHRAIYGETKDSCVHRI